MIVKIIGLGAGFKECMKKFEHDGSWRMIKWRENVVEWANK